MSTAHAWMPASPCGPDCLDRAVPRVGGLRAACRVVAALVVVLLAALACPALMTLGPAARERAVRTVFTALLRSLGVGLVVSGGAELAAPFAQRTGRGALVAVNHISWLDIVAVNAVQPMRSLAKREVGGWPILGGVVRRAGTVFVDRERLSGLPATVAELADALRGGSTVAVYAEGTTWCGKASGPFVPAPFQAALDGGVPVRPLALRYRTAGGPETTWPAFIGADSLLSSLWRVARLRGLVVEAHVCPEIAPGRAADRKELAALAEAAVRSALGDVALARARRRRAPAAGAATAGEAATEAGRQVAVRSGT